MISNLLKNFPSGSLTRVLGLTSVTSQVEVFNKLNSVEPMIRIEAIKWISENADSVKVKSDIESLLTFLERCFIITFSNFRSDM